MKILYRFRVGALAVAAILHNELIVSSPSVFEGLKYNGLLCNIAWEWFWAFERWEVAYCSCGVYGATCNVLLEPFVRLRTGWAKDQNRRSVGRALDWVGAKKSAIAFLFLFIVINEMKQTNM